MNIQNHKMRNSIKRRKFRDVMTICLFWDVHEICRFISPRFSWLKFHLAEHLMNVTGTFQYSTSYLTRASQSIQLYSFLIKYSTLTTSEQSYISLKNNNVDVNLCISAQWLTYRLFWKFPSALRWQHPLVALPASLIQTWPKFDLWGA